MTTANRLVSNGVFASGPITDDHTIDKFTLQAAARELSHHTGLAACLRVPIPNATTVEIVKNTQTGKLYYTHLCTCKQVWLCPICAERISNRRTAELMRALSVTVDERVIDVDGFPVVNRRPQFFLTMVTYTIGHKRWHKLETLLETLKSSYRRMWSGRRAQAFYDAFRIIGSVRALEVTASDTNGWHPHIHQLLVTTSAPLAGWTNDLLSSLADRWVQTVEAAGGYATSNRGIDVSIGDNTLLRYIDKAGQHIMRVKIDRAAVFEVGKTPAKRGHEGGRSLWQLLADYVGGDWQSGQLWSTAQASLRGSKQLVASPGIIALLDNQNALSDEIAGEQVQTPAHEIVLASLSLEQWRRVTRWNMRGALIEAARKGSPEHLAQWLIELDMLDESASRPAESVPARAGG